MIQKGWRWGALLLLVILWPGRAQAESTTPATLYQEARVVAVLEESLEPAQEDDFQAYQKLQLELTRGPQAGSLVVIESNTVGDLTRVNYQMGDRVFVARSISATGEVIYTITDYVRYPKLIWLFALFALVTIALTRKKGILAIVSMGISFWVIANYLLPAIIQGGDPVIHSVLTVIVILPVTFFLSHGPNRKTLSAVLSSWLVLIGVAVMSHVVLPWLMLSGFGSEEAGALQFMGDQVYNIRGILLAGIIIGTLGVLDDVTISQSAIVEQLKLTDPTLTRYELVRRAMVVGKDHITAVINTLVLVYAGAALPLFLLFSQDQSSFFYTINREMIAEEIVRTIVGSLGVVLAVPVSTYIATFFFSRAKPGAPIADSTAHLHGHHH